MDLDVKKQNNKNKRTLYVGGIPESATDILVKNAFITFGPVSSVNIPMDYQENKNRGFAFVEFQDGKDAEEALFNMNDAEILGSHIKVNFAVPEKNKNAYKPIWETDEYAQEIKEKLKLGRAEIPNENDDNLNSDHETNSKKSKIEKNASYRYTFFDISIGKRKAGRMVFKLNFDLCPKTVENFLKLSDGHSVGSYKNSIFHRIIPDFMAQGGDFTRGNGTGGCSIYGTSFADENFALKHDARGVLSMANSGPDSNGSQFFILFTRAPHLDNKHVVFGHMIEGEEVLDMIEAVGSGNGKPKESVKVIDSGELEV